MEREVVDVVGYAPALQPEFERLNRIWLEGHALLEPLDLEYLQKPEDLILAEGGQVFFAVRDSVVLGTCAAIRVSENTFELAKLAVDPTARRLGLGRRLCDAVIDYARRNGATEIILTSNTALTDAIRLYESMGFAHAPVPATVRYETVNVFMKMPLQSV